MFLKNHKRKTLLFVLLLAALCALYNPITAIFAQSEIRYLGEGAYWQDDKTVYCDYSTKESFKISTKVPMYNNTDQSKSNICAPNAGANVVGYYDRWCTNLMPNYEPGRAIGSIYIYSGVANNTQIQTMFDSLYSLMGTNVGAAGTTQGDFQSGLKSYVNGKGYSISYQSIGSTGNVNISTLDSKLRSNKIAVMFCNTYNFVDSITDNGTNVVVARRNSSLAHMLVAFGYSIYRYYRGGVCIGTDTFLDVASCTNSPKFYQIDLNGYLRLQDMLIVDIY